MNWNWQQADWPNFAWNQARLAIAEQQFLVGGGVLVGAVKHMGEEDRNTLTVEAMSTEALTTSEIEGEILDRASVQSSIRRQLGLAADNRKVAPAEHGVSEMMVALRKDFATPLSSGTLFEWHRKLMGGQGRSGPCWPLSNRARADADTLRGDWLSEDTFRGTILR